MRKVLLIGSFLIVLLLITACGQGYAEEQRQEKLREHISQEGGN